MLLVIDIGNTRVKWALADAAGMLSEHGASLHAEIAETRLLLTAKKANRAFVANVAGEKIFNIMNDLIAPLPIKMLQVTDLACGVENLYEQPKKLGADRWAAAVAAWHLTQKPTIIVNAGTAVTMDALNIVGSFLGGSIAPGLRLMQQSLSLQTAQLNKTDGKLEIFPKNTADAMTTGCMNAIIGAILLNIERQTVHYGVPPVLILTGGDALLIKQALKNAPKQGMMPILMEVPHLVLQGLVLLESERV
jgi:type III pantothenate kinase